MAILKPLSRRSILGALAGAALATVRRARGADRLDWGNEAAPALDLQRRYRADAHVLLFGMQLLHRDNVGGGSVVWREFDAGGRLLEFTGYSTPDRAAGLNRMGFIREMARPDESIYFGLMTASPEESADEARHALHSTAKEQTYTAIDGRMGGGSIETAVAHFSAPAAMSGARSAELVERARVALSTALKIEAPEPPGAPCPSFLHALAGLLHKPDGAEGRYSYSGRPYRIHLTRARDDRATESFRANGMLGSTGHAIRVAGRVRREAGGKDTDFRLWIAEGAEHPLPLRIEYQPKSYLRLVFEAIPEKVG